MDIILVKDTDNELSNIFNDYDNYAKRIFETNGIEQKQNIIKYRELKKTIDEWVLFKLKNVDNIKFSEYEYEEKIKNIVARNLLSNGLYFKSDIDAIMTKYKADIEAEIKVKIETFYKSYNGKVLIWNMDMECEYEIYKS